MLRSVLASLAGHARERIGVDVDALGIEGTHGYCDEEAKDRLRRLLSEVAPEGIHFLDSGHFHYLSLLFLEKIRQPFSLLVFDHHTDMQRPMFGAITSCGGWVREALETLPLLQSVCLIGPEADGAADISGKDGVLGAADVSGKDGVFAAAEGKFTLIAAQACAQEIAAALDSALPPELPVYLSFDKDVLGERDCRCDWDQGDMPLERAEELLSCCLRGRRLLGADICGEESRRGSLEGADGAAIDAVNDKTNRELLAFLEQRFLT